jgi:hypothetical protein
MLPQRYVGRWSATIVTLFAIGIWASLASLGGPPKPQGLQECGDTKTIWQNTSSQVMTVTATFTANCNQLEEAGNVDIYDSSAPVFTIVFKKGVQTFTFDVPAKGHIQYLCTPRHQNPDDQCKSTKDKAAPKT